MVFVGIRFAGTRSRSDCEADCRIWRLILGIHWSNQRERADQTLIRVLIVFAYIGNVTMLNYNANIVPINRLFLAQRVAA